MKTVRISSLVIGLLMIIQWIFFLATGNVPELESTPVSIIFHITIEIVTALLLVALSFLLSRPVKWKKYLAVYAQGMLGYTVINSSGYFAQKGDLLFLVMFAILLFFSLSNCIRIIRS